MRTPPVLTRDELRELDDVAFEQYVACWYEVAATPEEKQQFGRWPGMDGLTRWLASIHRRIQAELAFADSLPWLVA